MCHLGAGVGGVNLLSKLRSSILAGTILGNVIKTSQTSGGGF